MLALRRVFRNYRVSVLLFNLTFSSNTLDFLLPLSLNLCFIIPCDRGTLLVPVQNRSGMIYSSENLFQQLQVLFFILSGRRNVVNVGTVEAETTQGTFDEPLEGLGGIPQPERHS